MQAAVALEHTPELREQVVLTGVAMVVHIHLLNLRPGKRIQAVAAEGAWDTRGPSMALLVAPASCASDYTRKRNNKPKGERLCTTL